VSVRNAKNNLHFEYTINTLIAFVNNSFMVKQLKYIYPNEVKNRKGILSVMHQKILNMMVNHIIREIVIIVRPSKYY
ncbi:hypothetical protein Q8G17_03570, partial [Klebsiella pneumoniae]|uniref:hypothetical protein n=1 Tax=Klebsiella pneumoniae TaxID=573 RepID=UPI002731D321